MNRLNCIKIFILFSFFILMNQTGNNVWGQKMSPRMEKKNVKKGRKSFRKSEHWKAKSYYDKVTKAESNNPLYWYETGVVYFESKVESEKAVPILEKALELSIKDTIPEILLYLGHAYHFTGDFEKAIQYYNLFKSKTKDNKKGEELRKIVDHQIEICNNGIDLRNVPSERNAHIINMSNHVNSEYSDYAPVVTNDENFILFCSRRPPNRRKNMDGEFLEDIYYTKKLNGEWQDAGIIDKNSGYTSAQFSKGKTHEAPISISPDNNTLFIYKENGVWKSEKDKNGQWGIPEKMNQNVNIGTANPSIYITPLGNEMFISSYGASGSFGGRDLYYSKLEEDGTWSTPENLGPFINTEHDEDAPFMSKDGNTLYFASNGHNTMGGFDIYKSERDKNGNWGEPHNIGSPINSPGDDIYYMENDEGTIAYYASHRPGSYGYLDLYTATFECKNIPTTNVNGYAIYDKNHMPVDGIIKITNKTTGEEMGTFQINPQTGKYNMVLPPDQTYYLELVVAQSKYNQARPHKEEFYIPKQCEAYNLFQQISINYLKDEKGNVYAQKAHFRNAMFDIEREVEEYYSNNRTLNLTYSDSLSGIAGNILYNGVSYAKNISVCLVNEKNEIIRETKTDDNGDFAFENLNVNSKYSILIIDNEIKSQFGNSNYSLKGGVQKYIKDKVEFIDQMPIFIIDEDLTLINYGKSTKNGNFDFKNNSVSAEEIAQLNSNTIYTRNFDVSSSEVIFSAYVLTLDSNNNDLYYTEYIDIIDLKEIQSGDMQEFANLLFDFDKYFLRDKSKGILDNLYAFMMENPSVIIRLDGHTDWIGTEQYNEKLSEKRALTTYKFLIDKGIPPARVENAWFGETKPAVANVNADGTDNPENRQLNRRVEIKVDIPNMATLYIQL